jgi:prevent-host-death family protein
MTVTVGSFEAKTHLSSLLQRVEAGEEVTITKHGRPIARLVPVNQGAPRDWKSFWARVDEHRVHAGSRADIKQHIEEGRL